MYQINKYPDGTSYVSIPKDWRGQNITTIFRLNTYEDVIHLAQLCDVLTRNNCNAKIVIPCMLDAQADKRFNQCDSSGLKVLCSILNDYNKISFKVFHPHNPEVLEAHMPGVEIIDNSDFIKEVLKLIDKDLIVLLPDGGAYKWGVKLMDKLGFTGTVLACAKNRNFIDGKSKLTQQLPDFDFEGKDILIIDDICVHGGTFKGLANMLRARNCGKLYLAVSHITIEYHKQDSVFEYFDKVFTTNSKFDEYCLENQYREIIPPKNLEIIKMF